MRNLYAPYYGRKEWYKAIGPITVRVSWPSGWSRPTTLREVIRDASLVLYVASYWLACITIGVLLS